MAQRVSATIKQLYVFFYGKLLKPERSMSLLIGFCNQTAYEYIRQNMCGSTKMRVFILR